MITKAKAFLDSTGTVHATIEAAQRAELLNTFPANEPTENGGGAIVYTPETIVNAIFVNSDKIKDILSTTPKSRPGARAVNKGKKATPAVVKDGLAKARKAADAPVAA